MGVLLWRGFGLNAVMAQCFGNEEDKATRGRQMPMVRKTRTYISNYKRLNNLTQLFLLFLSAFWIARTPLPHDFLAARHSDTASGWSGLRVEARPKTKGKECCSCVLR